MTGSIVVAMGMIWVLAMVGGFFMLRRYWRRRQADLQRKLTEAVHRVLAEGRQK